MLEGEILRCADTAPDTLAMWQSLLKQQPRCMWCMVLWQQLDSEVRKGLGTTSQVTAGNLVWPAPCPGCDQQELAKDQPTPQAPKSHH